MQPCLHLCWRSCPRSEPPAYVPLSVQAKLKHTHVRLSEQQRAKLGLGPHAKAQQYQLFRCPKCGTWWQRGGWLAGDHCSGWYGVTCQLGHVT